MTRSPAGRPEVVPVERAIPGASPHDALDQAHHTIVELQQKVRARDEFLAIAAHELRNPMGAIALHVQSLLLLARKNEGALPDPFIARLEGLNRQIAHFNRRATTLLEVSRIADNQLVLETEPSCWAAAVRAAIDVYRAEMEARDIELHAVIPGSLPGTFDRMRIEQIAANLISNAIKYGEGKPIHVTLEDAPGHVVLDVRDHGNGVSPEDQGRIFERFERAVHGRGQCGFGVGLWLVRRIVDAMNGTIAIRSREGEGSTFTVRLPRSTTA